MLWTHPKQPGHWYLAKQCSRNFAACCGLTLPDTVIQKFRSELSNLLDLALGMRFVQLRWLQHDSPTGSHNIILCLLYWSSCPPSCFHRYPKEIRSVVPVLRCLEHRPGERPAWHVNLSRLCRLARGRSKGHEIKRLSCLAVILSNTVSLCVQNHQVYLKAIMDEES